MIRWDLPNWSLIICYYVLYMFDTTNTLWCSCISERHKNCVGGSVVPRTQTGCWGRWCLWSVSDGRGRSPAIGDIRTQKSRLHFCLSRHDKTRKKTWRPSESVDSRCSWNIFNGSLFNLTDVMFYSSVKFIPCPSQKGFTLKGEGVFMKLWKVIGQIFCLSCLLRAKQVSPVLSEQDKASCWWKGPHFPHCVKLNSCQISQEWRKAFRAVYSSLFNEEKLSGSDETADTAASTQRCLQTSSSFPFLTQLNPGWSFRLCLLKRRWRVD